MIITWWKKLLCIPLLIGLVTGLYYLVAPRPYHHVYIDNYTPQDFIVVIDGHQHGNLQAGEVEVVHVRDTRTVQLRWVDYDFKTLTQSINSITFAVNKNTNTMRITGSYGEFIVEEVDYAIH